MFNTSTTQLIVCHKKNTINLKVLSCSGFFFGCVHVCFYLFFIPNFEFGFEPWLCFLLKFENFEFELFLIEVSPPHFTM